VILQSAWTKNIHPKITLTDNVSSPAQHVALHGDGREGVVREDLAYWNMTAGWFSMGRYGDVEIWNGSSRVVLFPFLAILI